MGKNNQQRRAAKARMRQQRASGLRPEPTRPNPFVRDTSATREQERRRSDEAHALLQLWSRAATSLGAQSLRHVVASGSARTATDVLAVVEEQLVGELTARLARAWEHGWEPRDVAHAASRRARTGGHAAALIAAQARVSGAAARAPQRWRDQLAELGVELSPTHGPWRPVRTAVDSAQTWVDLLLLLKLLAELYPLDPVGPPPSQWGRQPTAAPSASTSERDRLLTRIRALLAKAEATNHAAEAETFTAKAQELMTRHAVDEAMLRGSQHEEIPVATRRVHLQAPYTGEKAILLSSVARANRCRVILLDAYDIAMLLGTPLDVDQSEMLFTSLLIQATRAMAEAGHRRAGSFDRSATFRRSFLTAYATRIGERLTEADRSTTATYGAELVPLLQREADAVTAEFERQFPHTRPSGSGYLDPRGWKAGQEAADRAALVAGRLSA